MSGSILRGAADSNYGRIPLTFAANRGQVHRNVRFTARGPGLTAYFTPGEVVIDLRGSAVRMRYLGANVSPGVEGLDLQEGRANFLIGNDPSQWKTDVPLYGSVIYKNLYPGIDMIYSSHTRLLKSEFVVAPGADPSQIQIAFAGVESVRSGDRGELILGMPDGELREEAPAIYQESAAGRDPVRGAFRVSGNVVSFFVEQYDRSRPLRIDPVLFYSTYLGGAGTDKAYAIAVDGAGAAYVTGYTDSTNFPVTGGQVASGGGVDAFVTKLNAAGSAIVYSTYIGGSGDDRGFSIAVDGVGNAYVTGWTGSTNFPVVSALQPSLGGGRDAFVAKLNSAGTALIYSTYLGGAANDSGNGIAIDAAGAAYITGSTSSSNFPLVGAFQALPGGQQDGFVAKLNAAGSALIYSTYLGGSADDSGSSIAVDSSGAAYLAGITSSTNFPTATALQPSIAGSQNAFIAKLGAGGNSLLFSTYLGGSGTENVEVGRSIVVDSAGSAYVTGTTSSTNFPVFSALQISHAGGIHDAFVTKLSPAGTALVYSTFLGGSGIDFGQSVAVDSGGSAYVTGYTSSTDFPTAGADQPANAGSYDVFVARLNPAGNALAESGFLGGTDSDTGYGIAIDSAGAAYVTGQTLSSTFPLKGPVQSSNGGTLAAFVAKFTFPSVVAVSPPVFTPPAGTYSSAQSVAIGSATAGASFRYSTDGSAPTSAIGTLYSGPISVASPTLLKAIAFKAGSVDSGVSTASYAITPPGTTASALFLRIDIATQGSWKGTYGASGEAIPNDSTSYPGYATVAFSGQSLWSWAASTNDVRAPQKAAAADRIASTWYSFSNFSIDINLTDGNSHQVALYCLDWDTAGRAERIEILDAASGAVLDTRNISGLSGGQYVVWNLAGHVTARITLTGGPNAVVNGIFFGAPPPAAASFIKLDTTTQGSWKGTYGSNGEAIANDSSNYPSYAAVSFSGQAQFTWAASTPSVQAPQKFAASDRIASTWYSESSFSVNLLFTDGNSHQVALYCLDWTSSARAQRIDILDAISSAVLDTRTISGFSAGQYLVWNLAGHVIVRVTVTGGPNAVVSGIFFGAPPPAAASFIKTDTITQGTWKGTYGASGEAIANDSANYPAFAAVTFSGQSQFTWAASTTSLAALQKAAAADRIASTWYFTPSFSLDVIITDGFSHQVALYCLDWDNAGRAERIDILDAATGAVLDSRTISGFSAGQYLVWNLAGHVTIRATVTAGSNAVIAGVFFN